MEGPLTTIPECFARWNDEKGITDRFRRWYDLIFWSKNRNQLFTLKQIEKFDYRKLRKTTLKFDVSKKSREESAEYNRVLSQALQASRRWYP